MTGKRPTEFKNEDGASVVKNSVQTLQNSLWRQVHLVEKYPVTYLQGAEKGRVPPLELAWPTALDGKVGTKKIHNVALIRKIYPAKSVTHG